MKPGFKRIIFILMIIATPLVFADPMLQQFFIPSPAFQRMDMPKILKVPEFVKPLRTGKASWYSETDPGIHFRTANGEIFDDTQLTCASWVYPFGTYLKITNLANGKSVICRVNDRGPSKRLHREIDLTKTAFRHLASLRHGLIDVSVENISPL